MDQVGNDCVGCILLASNCCFVVGVGLSTSLGIEDTASAVDVVSGVNTSVFGFCCGSALPRRVTSSML